MQITQCLHTAILVSELERAEHFYSTLLGLVKVDRVLKYPGAWYQVGNFQIHLIADSNHRKLLYDLEKWGRNPHIALAVDNLGEAIARLQTHGCPIQMSQSGRPALFTQDPDGNIIEISQG
jgi:glyoxylase I family protein